MPRFLIGHSDSQFGEKQFAFVDAQGESAAVAKFAERFAPEDGNFEEHVLDRSVNMSFAEHFWLQTKQEQQVFDQSGEILADEQQFAERVRAFFGERGDFADLYLNHYFADHEDDDAFGDDESVFPDEMMVCIWLALPWTDLTVVDVSEIEAI